MSMLKRSMSVNFANSSKNLGTQIFSESLLFEIIRNLGDTLKKIFYKKNNFPFVEMISRGTNKFKKRCRVLRLSPTSTASIHLPPPGFGSLVPKSGPFSHANPSPRVSPETKGPKAGRVCWGTCHKITGLVAEPPI